MVEFLIKNSAITQLLVLILATLVIVLQTFTIRKLRRLLSEALKTLKETLETAISLADINDELIKQIDDDWAIIDELIDRNKCSKVCGKNCCKNKKPKK